MTMRSVVVLPAPLGPEQAEDAAARHGQGQVLHGHVAGEGLAHAGETDGRVAHAGISPRAHPWGRRVYHRASARRFPGRGSGVSEPSAAPRPFRVSLQAKLLAVVLLCVVRARAHAGRLFLLRRNQEILREKVEEGLSSHLLRKQSAFDDWMERPRCRRPRAGRRRSSSTRARALSRPAAARVARGARPEVVPRVGARATTASTSRCSSWTGEGRVLDGHARRAARGLGARRSCRARSSCDGVLVSPMRKSAVPRTPHACSLLRPIPPPGRRSGADARSATSWSASTCARWSRCWPRTPPTSRPRRWLLDEEGRILARAGKVVDDRGRARSPLPAGADAASGGGSVVAQADAAGARAHRVRPAQPRGPVPRPAGRHRAQRARLPDARRSRAAASSSRAAAAAFMIAILNFVGARELLRPILAALRRRQARGRRRPRHLPARARQRRDRGPHARVQRHGAAGSARGARASRRRATSWPTPTRACATRTARWRRWPSPTASPASTTAATSRTRWRRRSGACEQQGAAAQPAPHRHRPLQAVQRPLRPPRGRRRAAAGGRPRSRRAIRSTDMAFRYGGEELAVLLPVVPQGAGGGGGGEDPQRDPRRTRRAPGRFGGPLTVSIGVATFPEDGARGRARWWTRPTPRSTRPRPRAATASRSPARGARPRRAG